MCALALQDRFLHPLLQQYQATLSETEFTAADWALAVLATVGLILGIVTWIALWHGWRSGRRLYTIIWLIFTPSLAFSGPVVSTGIVDCLHTLVSGISGAILALLYFSDLRHLYEGKVLGGTN